jgi:hypothetical protein
MVILERITTSFFLDEYMFLYKNTLYKVLRRTIDRFLFVIYVVFKYWILIREGPITMYTTILVHMESVCITQDLSDSYQVEFSGGAKRSRDVSSLEYFVKNKSRRELP